LITSRN